ncbi:MAG: glycosyltransferase family protein [Rhodospirillales bacterium]|nr:glycosyltransferase family protein [Rhodospirillales bacterium]MBO6787798.1 glycosyltransferase family protein [Rhodospirillales bacterium]
MSRITEDDPQVLALAAAELLRERDYVGAAKIHRRRTEVAPDNPLAWRDLGDALNKAGLLEDAATATEHAIALDPEDPHAFAYLAVIQRNMGDMTAALSNAEKAIGLNPGIAAHHVLHAELLLAQGDFLAGFREYEWRLGVPEVFAPAGQSGLPMWDGAEIDGHVLLTGEQGFGDTLQFSRFALMAAGRAAGVTFVVHAPLKSLLASLPEITVVAFNEPVEGAFEATANIASLPHLFGITRESVPASVPYLRASDAAREKWHTRAPLGAGLRVGLGWRGNPSGSHDRGRSVTLDQLIPLSGIEGVTFHSLQRDAETMELASWPKAIHDLGTGFETFDDTAAAVSALDLVITTDTALAHVAGATGHPVWLLLKRWPAWRWGLDGAETPWYPTMRVFRQPETGDWESVVADASTALQAFISDSRPPV